MPGINGILNINKPAGMTSHDVVAIVRKMSRESRVGHAGTLDPLATGVLLVCIGQATRVAEYLTDHDKKYRARVRLGIETDTYDAQGTVVSEHEVSVSLEQVEEALQSFVGSISQMPPAYSAIKQQGTPLYKLARQGVEVETEPRQIVIHSIALTEFTPPDLEVQVHCSKGTYIRSLAHDLGAKLGTGAHITALTRTMSGQFSLDTALTLDQLRDAFLGNYVEQFLSPLDEALLQFEAVVVEPGIVKRIQQGNPLPCERGYATPLLRVYSTRGELIALMERGDAPKVWKPKKVFLL
ncbi:MAG: tRNA pseudouridine(55) synthase TruB [Chloroflexi bacterium]|nr:tRNA pseudouridine(55) synthase TruB [Chloroflexota bacterium]